MQWLLHGSLTPAVAEAMRRHEQVVHTLTDAALADNPLPQQVLKAAHGRQWDLLTNDPKLAEAPFSVDERFNRCLVFLQLAGGDVEQDDAIDRLFTRYKRLTPGRLYTVTGSRVKIRQLPTQRPGSTGYKALKEVTPEGE